MTTPSPILPQRTHVIKCTSGLEADTAAKVISTLRRALAAGFLGDTWTLKVGRHNGGKIRVWIDSEAPQAIDPDVLSP